MKNKVKSELRCPNCGSLNLYKPDGASDMIKCKACKTTTDYYEASKTYDNTNWQNGGKVNARADQKTPGIDTLVNPLSETHFDFSDLINTFQELEYATLKEEEMKKQKEKDDLLFVDELLDKSDLHLRGCDPDNVKVYERCGEVRHQLKLDIVKRMTNIRRDK